MVGFYFNQGKWKELTMFSASGHEADGEKYKTAQHHFSCLKARHGGDEEL